MTHKTSHNSSVLNMQSLITTSISLNVSWTTEM